MPSRVDWIFLRYEGVIMGSNVWFQDQLRITFPDSPERIVSKAA